MLFYHKIYLQIQKKQNQLDKILSNTKYPSEFPRTQRKLKELKRFKASEFRNFIFYLAPALKEILSAEIFNHYLVYATAIRLLTDDCLELDHIKSAQNLINYFVRTFSDIYGIENMPYVSTWHKRLCKSNIPKFKF